MIDGPDYQNLTNILHNKLLDLSVNFKEYCDRALDTKIQLKIQILHTSILILFVYVP